MAGGEDTKVGSFYQALIGETFTGTHWGTFNRQAFNPDDTTSKTWLKIALGSMSPRMEAGLQAIVDNFEGRIWKGFHEGIMYINPEDHSDLESIMGAGEFKIVSFKILPFHRDCKEPGKYTNQYGCCFILEAV